MAGLIFTYFLLIALGIPHIKAENLAYTNWELAPWLLPVMIISFGFHNMIPSLKTYLGGDVKRVRMAVICGSLLPLAIYFAWEWVIMGLMSDSTHAGLADVLDEGKMATEMLKSAAGNLWVVDVAHYFAFFAIVTSFLGNSLSFVDFLADGLGVKKTPWGKFFLCALVIAPPFVMALIYPNIFLSALNYAGAFGAVILFGILPALMAWSGRYRQGMKGTFRVFGGKFTLVAVILFAVCVMGMQLLLDKGA
jgi:tyrosine-specific transport protein